MGCIETLEHTYLFVIQLSAKSMTTKLLKISITKAHFSISYITNQTNRDFLFIHQLSLWF